MVRSTAKKKSKKIQSKSIFFGDALEPSWDKEKTYSQLDLILALRWYNDNKTEKDACSYLKINSKHVANYLVVAWCERMISRGFTLPDIELNTYKLKKKELLNLVKLDKEERKNNQNDNVISIQDRITEKTDYFIGELEGLVDDYGMSGNHKDVNFYEWMLNNDVKAAHSKKIADHFQNSLSECSLALNKKDDYFVEAYSAYTPKRLKNLVSCLSNLVADAKRIDKNQAATRKPRKKRSLTADKKVAKINYMKSYSDLKLQSINPEKIIGCEQLWVYNVKTKKLGVYNSFDSSGISVKGSTLTNYAESSICKTLRKPEEILPRLISGGKMILKKIMGEVNTKPSKLNGRINKDTILLRSVP